MVDKRIIDLYNEYVHTALPRREFLARLAKVAGGAAAATTVLAVLEPNYALARQVEPDDKRLRTEKIEFNGPNGAVKAYVARPRKLGRTDRVPGVLVIHENRGLNEHIEDVARRTALLKTLDAVGTPYAREVRDRVIGGLDRYAADWRASHLGACRDHRKGATSAALLDRRMICLDERLSDLRAAANVAERTDAASLTNVVDVVARMPPIARCSEGCTRTTTPGRFATDSSESPLRSIPSAYLW